MKLRASPESFFQVNLEQNQALIRTVLQFGEVKEGERVLDLYAGIGNFSLPLGLKAREVVGIEENRAAVEDARFNAKENRIDRCRVPPGKDRGGFKALGKRKTRSRRSRSSKSRRQEDRRLDCRIESEENRLCLL